MSALVLPSIKMKHVVVREGLVLKSSVYYGEIYFEDGSSLALDRESDFETAAREACDVAFHGGCPVSLFLLPKGEP